MGIAATVAAQNSVSDKNVTALIAMLRGIWHGETTTWDSPEALTATLWATLPQLHPQMRRACAYFAASGQADHPLYRAMAPFVYRCGEALPPTADKMRRLAETRMSRGAIRAGALTVMRVIDACYAVQATPVPLPINSQVVACAGATDFPRSYIDRSAVPPGYEIAAAGSGSIFVIEHRQAHKQKIWWVRVWSAALERLDFRVLERCGDREHLPVSESGLTAQDFARADALHLIAEQIKRVVPAEGDISVFLRRLADGVLQPFVNDSARHAERDDVERAVAVLRQWTAPAPVPAVAPAAMAARRPISL